MNEAPDVAEREYLLSLRAYCLRDVQTHRQRFETAAWLSPALQGLADDFTAWYASRGIAATCQRRQYRARLSSTEEYSCTAAADGRPLSKLRLALSCCWDYRHPRPMELHALLWAAPGLPRATALNLQLRWRHPLPQAHPGDPPHKLQRDIEQLRDSLDEPALMLSAVQPKGCERAPTAPMAPPVATVAELLAHYSNATACGPR